MIAKKQRWFGFALFATLVCQSAFCSSSFAQDKKDESPLVGAWKWQRDSLSGKARCELHIVEKDGQLSGTYKDAEDVKAKVTSASLDGKDVKITLKLEGAGEVEFAGTLKGRRITGTMTDGGEKQDWKARRFVPLADAAGKWQLSFTTPDGVTRNPELVIKDVDGKAEIEFDDNEDTTDESDAEFTKTTYKDGLLILHITMSFQGQELKLEYELECMNESEMEGSMFFEFGNDMAGDVDVEGKKIK